MSSEELPLDVTEYATLAAILADPACDRERVLASRGLDEDAWNALDRRWQDRLALAMEEEESDGIPPLIAAFAEAFERARTATRKVESVISIERFAEATREISLRGDPTAALAKVGVSLEDFIRANEHWTRRMLEDPELLARFRAKLGV
jgi:hypothetical protein